MDYLKRLLNSRLISRRFQLPSARTLKVFALVMAIFSSSTSLYVFISTLIQSHPAGASDSVSTLHAIGGAAANLFVCALLTLMLLVIWGIYYRIVMDICRGVVRFIHWAPGAWYRFRNRAQAAFYFVIAIPGMLWDLGARFVGAIWRFMQWIVSIPSRWRNLTGKEKSGVVFSIAFIGIYFGTFVAMYPVARKLSAAAPSWLIMSDAPFMQTLMIDLVVGSFTAMLLVTVLALIASALRQALGKR
ncbi:MAG: hypothetical protein KGS72_26410 [Cyanobacteria bacterium REEB67]|nr:hypothetical protein [Cyanobacteria bacterium REEB67]